MWQTITMAGGNTPSGEQSVTALLFLEAALLKIAEGSCTSSKSWPAQTFLFLKFGFGEQK